MDRVLIPVAGGRSFPGPTLNLTGLSNRSIGINMRIVDPDPDFIGLTEDDIVTIQDFVVDPDRLARGVVTPKSTSGGRTTCQPGTVSFEIEVRPGNIHRPD